MRPKQPPAKRALTARPKDRARCEARARVLKALAHHARLFMVDELSRGERCVCELQSLVGLDMSTVSKHLSVMKAAGVVQDDKRGLQVFYRLRCPCILQFLDCIDTVMKAAAEAQWRLVEK